MIKNTIVVLVSIIYNFILSSPVGVLYTSFVTAPTPPAAASSTAVFNEVNFNNSANNVPVTEAPPFRTFPAELYFNPSWSCIWNVCVENILLNIPSIHCNPNVLLPEFISP